MYEKVKEFILSLTIPGRKLRTAVSYSGGADSGVLLDMMMRMYRENLIFMPDAIYFNHNLRGKESAEEEAFVKKTCTAYDIRLVIIELDVKTYAQKNGLTVETAARDLRYENYGKLFPAYDLIAQGHHADDNAETVFFNIMRGSGLEGASGIKRIRDKMTRPLLDMTRNDILSYAKKNRIKFVEDSSNCKNEYSRNKIRNIVFPLIKNVLNREITGSINSFSDSVSEAADFISGEAEKKIRKITRTSKGLVFIKRSSFLKLIPVIKKAVLHKAVKAAGAAYNPDRIKTGIIMEGILKGERSVFSTENYSITIHTDNIIILNPVEFMNPAEITFKKKSSSIHYLDPLKIKGNVICRDIVPGDVFRPFGKKKPEKVSKVLSDRKIPVVLRKNLKCLADSEKIVFIQGTGISDSVRTDVNEDTMFINVRNDILKKLFK